jgi:hypothetical protein
VIEPAGSSDPADNCALLGAFLEDSITVPLVVIEALASQLSIADPSFVKRHVDRGKTRLEHRRQICYAVGWREFVQACGEVA